MPQANEANSIPGEPGYFMSRGAYLEWCKTDEGRQTLSKYPKPLPRTDDKKRIMSERLKAFKASGGWQSRSTPTTLSPN